MGKIKGSVNSKTILLKIPGVVVALTRDESLTEANARLLISLYYRLCIDRLYPDIVQDREEWEQINNILGLSRRCQPISDDDPIERLDLKLRSYNRLKEEGINTVKELMQKTEDDLMGIEQFGRTSLEDVQYSLAFKAGGRKLKDDHTIYTVED